MFNIKTFTFEFSDISIYCVGSKGNIDMLHLFYIAHKNSIDPELFLKRIIKCDVLAYFEGKNPIYTFKAQKYNNSL